MKKNSHNLRYSIWIDSRLAMILRVEPSGSKELKIIESQNSRRERYDGETSDKNGLFGTYQSRENHVQHKWNNHHINYLKKVADELFNVNALLILGSGDTRFELQNVISKGRHQNGIWIENKAMKKITPRELEIETEKHFNLSFS